MDYAHAERNRIATQHTIDATVATLLRLPEWNEEQLEFMREFAANANSRRRRRGEGSSGAAQEWDETNPGIRS